MRQWAHSELDSTPSGRPSGKRRPRVIGSPSLQELSANNLQVFLRSPGSGGVGRGDDDDDENVPRVRLSRHIPQREGMDMAVSSYNLTTTAMTKTTSIITPNPISTMPINGGGAGGGGGNGANGGGRSLPLSATTSYSSAFSESFVSDDSSYATSIYNEVLAEQLSSEGTQGHRKIGGDVLRFDNTCGVYNRKGLLKSGVAISSSNGGGGGGGGAISSHSDGRGNSYERGGGRILGHTSDSRLFDSSPTGRALMLKRLKPCKSVPQRVLFTNPERVLDAPEFPVDASQLLHWGTNNKLIIGLKNCLYGWNSETTQASRIVQLQENMQIRAVHWLHKCTCTALVLDEGTTAIYDCRREEFLRTLRVQLPSGAEFTHLAVNGPLLAIGSSTACGGVYVFDLRAKQALISVYEGHTSGITSLNYCTQEPFYLASGGAEGAVRVWDARRSSCPRYAFDKVHRGSVNSILWNPDKRSKMYTGGQDGMLCYVDTHAPMTNLSSAMRGDDEGTNTDTHSIVRAINTLYPITGIVSPPGVGELSTSHRGSGQIQVRNTNKFHLIGTLSSPNCEASISCMTLAPDMERICAAQDETLKFWRVFGPAVPLKRTKSATPPPPVSLLEEELR
ncbi:putative WD40 repeat protein [Trypanosoma theileri]|uniref:Putative WD40 repeat protein n=1 Tax=Trypanosoma theileri TaxID=67003 RepID=A0A1X0P1T2_9TRYP|nr:putative WD40 repeat protein [Trypanosoma theileri]ORC90479.1 putative WD40 repeat protein [Trypanosoma theileri]